MNEDNRRRLVEWYGTYAGAAPKGQADGPERAADTPEQIPPCRPSGSSPMYHEPYWSCDEDRAEPGRRRKHTGARIAGVCMLLVLVIAATALLFSGRGDITALVRPTASGGADRSMEEFFDKYYDESSTEEWSNSMPRAETGTGVTLALTPRPGQGELSLGDVYAKCINSVVYITAETDGGAYLLGTGIIMTGDGYILTNSHVLSGAKSATVKLWDDREFPAVLVGADSASDLAVLKIDASGLPAAEFCADSVRVGEGVAAIGNPLGEELRGTMTDGIISAVSRNLSYTGYDMDLIQTNAAINEGNSGGPLLNMYGQVVGMTSMKLVSSQLTSSIEGIGFAIPVSTLKSVADELIANGRILGRPVLGITVGEIPDYAREYFEIPNGLYVDNVSLSSNAAERGLAKGDIITAVNGTPVTDLAGFSAILGQYGVGDSVTLTVFRSGESFELTVELMEFADVYQ